MAKAFGDRNTAEKFENLYLSQAKRLAATNGRVSGKLNDIAEKY